MHLDKRANWDCQQPASSDDRVDVICDAFEAAWNRGTRPDVGEFLSDATGTERLALFTELVLLDYEFRMRNSERPTKTDYLQRYPEFADVLELLAFTGQLIDSVGPDLRDECRGKICAGQRIGRFELIERLGVGSAGEVWRAMDSRLKRAVAVKIPRAPIVSDDELNRFLREARTAARLRHTHIVSVHEAGREGNTTYIVSEIIEGEDLRQRLSNGHYGHRGATELCATVADALHHAHECGVVHRDLKPANILLDGNGEPHIADFGLAKVTEDSHRLTLHGQLVGTLAYMSPEQARGDAAGVDRRADVFALGVILYELLTAKCPFQGDDVAVLHGILHNEPPNPRILDRTIPRDLETICLKAIHKEVNKRYATAQDMAVDLRRFLRGDRPLARRTGRLEKGWRWLRRRPSVATSIVLAVGVALAGVAILSLRDQNYQIQGYRPVEIDTSPSGARLAIVPLNRRTGEPTSNAQAVILPRKLTPLQIRLKPGTYLIEALLPNGKRPPDFAEVYRTIAPVDMLPSAHSDDGVDEGPPVHIQIQVHRFEEVAADMVLIPIDDELRRRNPLLPDAIYIDAEETQPDDIPALNNDPLIARRRGVRGERYILFADARQFAEERGKRLLSAMEYDAIGSSTNEAAPDDSIRRRDLPADFHGGLPEWTTTTFDYTGAGTSSAIAMLRSMHVLRGHDDPSRFPSHLRSADGQLISSPEAQSPLIGFRGAHTAAPRFLKP